MGRLGEQRLTTWCSTTAKHFRDLVQDRPTAAPVEDCCATGSFGRLAIGQFVPGRPAGEPFGCSCARASRSINAATLA